MNSLVIVALVSAIIAGTSAQAASPNAVDWNLIQESINETVYFIHAAIDNAGELATKLNPGVGRLVTESLKTSLKTTIDPLLTGLVNAAMNEVLTKEVIEAQREVLKNLLFDAYEELLLIIDPLGVENVDKIYKVFTDLATLVDDDFNNLIRFLNPAVN